MITEKSLDLPSNSHKPKALLHFEVKNEASGKDWILFIHGAGGSTKTWKRQIDVFKKKYNLLMIDLPGHGNNADRETHFEEYSFPNISNKIWEVVDHFNIQKLHIVGVSLGAIFCLQMCVQHPHRVLSVIMPGAIVKLNWKLRLLASLSLALAKVIGYRNLYNMSAHIMMPRRNHKKSRDVFIKESQVLTSDEFKKWTSLYYGLNDTLSDLFLKKYPFSQLLVMGSQDHLFLKPAQDFAKYHNYAKISIIEECGHVVSIEKAELFNEICLKFLSDLVEKNMPERGFTA